MGGYVSPQYDSVVATADKRRPGFRSAVARAREGLIANFGSEARGDDYLALGGWTEAARLAAKRSDAAFFRTRESRSALEAAAKLDNLDGEAKRALARLQAAVDQRQVANWDAVREDLDTLQDKLAR